MEFLVHAWDFARATQQTITVDDALSKLRPRARAIVDRAPDARRRQLRSRDRGRPDADSLTAPVGLHRAQDLTTPPPRDSPPRHTGSRPRGTDETGRNLDAQANQLRARHPNWVDLQSSDPDAAKTFYGGLFGWQFDDSRCQAGLHTRWQSRTARVLPPSPDVARLAAKRSAVLEHYIAVDDVNAAPRPRRVQAAVS